MLDRRQVLARLGGFVACTVTGIGSCPLVARAQEMAQSGPVPVPLRIFNANTREAFDLQLFVGTAWNANALVVADWLMRDWRQNRQVECDRRLYAALYVLQRYFNENGRVQINSGFRTETTNDLLRTEGMNTAVNSQHLHARAVDFTIPGTDLRNICRSVWNLGLGGVGYYSREGFCHMDTRGTKVNWGDNFG